jgi:hypothetical protein
MSGPKVITAFERRRRRAKTHRRDLVQFRTDRAPELQARLDRLEIDVIDNVRTRAPEVDEFLEWYADEARKYGLPIRPGLAALYWLWARPRPNGEIPLDAITYEALRDHMAENLRGEQLDSAFLSGRTLVQEFIWWSAGDWPFVDYLLLAIVEFREYRDLNNMPHWRRKKRRRLAAAARKAAKEARAAIAAMEAGQDDEGLLPAGLVSPETKGVGSDELDDELEPDEADDELDDEADDEDDDEDELEPDEEPAVRSAEA